MMETFLITVERNSSGSFVAQFSNGANVELAANDYTDAVLEADCLDAEEYLA
jgi:hypothetical protein